MKVLDLLEEELPNYIHEVKSKHQENAKAFAFSSFIQKVFDVKSEDLDFEKSVKSEVMQMRGRIDAVFGNLIIEFKKDLESGLDTAREELLKYFQSYLENDIENFLGIANDGIRFKVFSPIIKDNQVVDIEEIDQIDLEKSTIREIFLWFDSYFFSTEKIVPTSDDIKRRFGLDSPTFRDIHRKLEQLFEKALIDKRTHIKYESWNKYLEIVYGDKPNERKLFFKHTYLSTFVKLLVNVKIAKGKPGMFEEVIPILYGNTFTQYGIKNFMEEDFFSWILAPNIKKQSSKIFYNLLQEIYVYDLEKIDEDVLKELYQELVDPDVRKLLGEFYTPDWLAQSMVHQILEKDPEKSIMDPSCGSGTFLFKAIQYKIEVLSKKKWPKDKILEHIVDNVIGFDVHPLAVVIARTNYLLALKDIIHAKKDAISIPVYLSDSLKIPIQTMDVSTAIPTFEFAALDKKFQFPVSIASDLSKMDQIVEILRDYGQQYELKLENMEQLSRYKFDPDEYAKNMIIDFGKMASNKYNDSEAKVLLQSLETLYDLIKRQEDAIWPYVLRNMYKPIAISFRKVDVVIGNPPWLVLKVMKNLSYQEYLKKQSLTYNLADSEKIHNIPNLELATLFFCHCTEKYLKKDGKIAFVMPRSVLLGSQHENFLKFEKPEIKLEKIWDLENIEPLFRIPSCVLFGEKNSITTYPVDTEKISGNLPIFNSQLIEAEKFFQRENAKFIPAKRSVDHSYYHNQFARGADIIPRCFWFMDIKSDSFLGFNPASPLVETEYNKYAKKPWDKVSISGNVERQFLFNTILSTDIVPFGCMRRHLVFLPIFVREETVEIINDSNDLGLEYSNTVTFLKEIEKMWNKHNKEKAKGITAYEWVNYRNKLTSQNPFSSFKVIYVASATYLTSFVVKPNEAFYFDVDGKKFETSGFFADSTIYYFDTDSKDEAFYLSSILNSYTLDKMLKPLQAAGSFGPRHLHKLPLTFPIPKYDSKNSEHLELAKLGKRCHDKTEKILPTLNYKSTGKIRSVIRTKLETEYQAIEDIVKTLFEK